MTIPSVSNRDNSGFVLSNVLKDRLREVKVLTWRVTPTTVAIGWAEVGGGNKNGAR